MSQLIVAALNILWAAVTLFTVTAILSKPAEYRLLGCVPGQQLCHVFDPTTGSVETRPFIIKTDPEVLERVPPSDHNPKLPVSALLQ